MLDHRMIVKSERPGHAHALRARLHALELYALLEIDQLGAGEPGEEIEVPPGTAELAVGDRREPDVFLLPDDLGDLAVLDRLEVGVADLTLGVFLARLLERRRAQQAADVIGAERRLGSLGHAIPPFPGLPLRAARFTLRRARDT
jgi:hypothetical protein